MKDATKRLPDTEFSVMKIIWGLEAPVTTHMIMDHFDESVNWKPQTLITVLARLAEKGFLDSTRVGRERCYTPIISEQEYLEVETGSFLKRYSGNSIGGLVKNLYSDGNLTSDDLKELRELLLDAERK